MPQPRVHVLVINWNGREHLDACFRSLIATPYENARFVLVDNASSDGSIDFVRDTFGDDLRVAILALAENRGWSGGNNAGIQQALDAGADFVFLLNNDTEVAPDCLPKLIEAAEADPEIGVLTPKILLYDHPDIINSVGLTCSVIGACWDIGLGRIDRPVWNQPQPVIGACGAAALLRCEALRTTGLLPEDFDIYLDDLDLSLRIWQAGYTVWSCPAAVVRHKFSATMGEGDQFHRKYCLNVRNRMRVMRRNFPASKLPLVAPALAWGECRAVGRALLDGEPWKARAHIQAWADGLRYRPAAIPALAPNGACHYWHLVRTKPLFFPGIPLPDPDGWYAPIQVKGMRYRPMARRAVHHHAGGRLRITLLGRYDLLGAAQVRVEAAGQSVVRLMQARLDACIIDAPPGLITLTAERIFDAEATGEPMDSGGWLAIEPLEDNPRSP